MRLSIFLQNEDVVVFLLKYFVDCSCHSQVLHATSQNKNAWKSLIAAEYSGVQVELVKFFEMGVSNTTPEFLKMNPLGKVSHEF